MADPAPDLYIDQFSMSQTPYGVALMFALSPSLPSPTGQNVGDPQVTVRMSIEHAKIMAMMIRKNLKQYELEHLGDSIKVPQQVLLQLKLSDTDW